MCCFSRPVRFVADTNIFARALDDGRQALVYEMTIEADEPLAMILPLPVPIGCGDEAVRFVDLQGYASFFAEVRKGFPIEYLPQPQSFGPPSRAMLRPKTLQVHAVGKFEASFVPTIADFNRLDARFRLPTEVWGKIPRYTDYGFAVFQLRVGKGVLGRLFGKVKKETIHPMAFVFPRRDPTTIFYPTVHVHDGEVHAEANFDHTLYGQFPVQSVPSGWQTSTAAASAFLDEDRAQGMVDGAMYMHRSSMKGKLKNDDVVIPV